MSTQKGAATCLTVSSLAIFDGVIFNFNKRYTDWLNEKFQVKIPPDDAHYPNTWHYATDGQFVTTAQEKEFWAWASTEGNYQFWRFLPIYPGAVPFLRACEQAFEDIYFISSRPGTRVQKASEDALKMLGVSEPKVIISDYKVPDLFACGATHFLDDRDKNFEDIVQSNRVDPPLPAQLFLLDRPWNRHFSHPEVTRLQAPLDLLRCV